MERLKWWQFGVLVGLGVVTLGTIGYLVANLGVEDEPKKKKKSRKLKGHGQNIRSDRQNSIQNQQESFKDNVQIFDTLLKEAQKAREKGDYPLAEDYAKRAVRFANETLGSNSEVTGFVYYMLYEIYYERHKIKEAEEALNNARLCLKNTTTHSDLYNAIVLHLADLYNYQERYTEAEPLFEEAVTYLEKHLSGSTSETNELSLGITLSSLAYTKSKLQKFLEAEGLIKKAFDIIVSKMGFGEMFSIHCALRYGQVLIEQGKVEEAERLFKDCLQKAEQEQTNNEEMKFHVLPLLHRLGELYFELGNYSEAESYWLKSQQIGKEQNYDQHILCDLANLYWQTGRNDEAKALQERLKSQLGSRPQLLLPRSTSKYLRTIEVSLESGAKPNIYHIILEIKRDLTSRESAAKRKLKLPPGTFFELHFQNPEKETEPIIKTVELKEGETFIEVTTEPVMFVKDQHWYEIEVFIFADKTKQNKLGVHHQIVRAIDSDLAPPPTPQYKIYLKKSQLDRDEKTIPIYENATTKQTEPNISGF